MDIPQPDRGTWPLGLAVPDAWAGHLDLVS